MSRAGISIAGQRFGVLVALRQGSKRGDTYAWIYRCECGREIERVPSKVKAAAKRNGDTRCQACKSSNKYTINNGKAVVDVSTQKHPNASTTIDLDYLYLLDGNGRWHAALEANGKLYVTRKYQGQRLHREIMANPGGLEVDHINGDSLDNRKSNLRSITRKENARNAKLYSDNKTGYPGVSIVKGRYTVYAVIEDKNTYLGTFDNLKDAVEVRARHAGCYHQNHGRKEAV